MMSDSNPKIYHCIRSLESVVQYTYIGYFMNNTNGYIRHTYNCKFSHLCIKHNVYPMSTCT